MEYHISLTKGGGDPIERESIYHKLQEIKIQPFQDKERTGENTVEYHEKVAFPPSSG